MAFTILRPLCRGQNLGYHEYNSSIVNILKRFFFGDWSMATKAKTARQTPLNARRRREQERAEAARQRRNQNLFLLGAAVVLVVIVGWFIYLNFRGQVPMAGEEIFESQGNNHIDFGARSTIEYNSIPPSSGPHYGNLAAWQIYEDPIRYEQLVHNLEDGGVVVYYQCEDPCPELVEQLSAAVQPHIDAGRHVILLPNDPTWAPNDGQPLHKDMGAPIALTAWGRVLKLDEFDADVIRAFIGRYEGIDHHLRSVGS